MRKLATIQEISALLPIEGADAIELALILGWQTVVKKGEFQVNDKVVFVEVDAWVPLAIAPFLQKGDKVRTFEGIEGNKLKTIKLRGQLSQGLVLPLNSLPDYAVGNLVEMLMQDQDIVDTEVTEYLGIVKWELPEFTGGGIKGMRQAGTFPSEFPKTDQTRYQNIRDKEIQEWIDKGYTFEVTEKLEGSSCTAGMLDGKFFVASRNMLLERDDNNAFWKAVNASGLEKFMRELNLDNLAFQGELIGPGIQGNIYELKDYTWRIFDIVNTRHEYFNSDARRFLMPDSVQHSPIIANNFHAEELLNRAKMLNAADGISLITPKTLREGLVFKCNEDPSISFKIVSNKYLLNQK